MRFVGTEIIEHDNVSGSECRDKDLPDIELEQFAVDWAVDDPRRGDASQSCRSSRRFSQKPGTFSNLQAALAIT